MFAPRTNRLAVLARDWLRRAVPRSVRVEWVRLRRLPRWILEAPLMARARVEDPRRDYPICLAWHESPLQRGLFEGETELERGKAINVAIAASRLDGVRVDRFQVLSYHHLVGRPSRRRGFAPGLELHAGEPAVGIGGGCCQVSNMLYLLALRGGMKIVERHRHALDLFPDRARSIPFGLGATVFYNAADLRFENPLPFPVLLRFDVRDGVLRGELRAPEPPDFRVEVYQEGHRFAREPDGWIRENWIRRRFSDLEGNELRDELVAHNRCRVCYEPTSTQTDEESRAAGPR
ncbi:MAG: VanW family protein [Myxococcales bacterium]|nr:VanW family protein [Myxococcales bacterium]